MPPEPVKFWVPTKLTGVLTGSEGAETTVEVKAPLGSSTRVPPPSSKDGMSLPTASPVFRRMVVPRPILAKLPVVPPRR